MVKGLDKFKDYFAGYEAFLSGPRRFDGYYVYGVSFAQMSFATDSAAVAAIEAGRNSDTSGEGNDGPPGGTTSSSSGRTTTRWNKGGPERKAARMPTLSGATTCLFPATVSTSRARWTPSLLVILSTLPT